jgi:hypothetical protein
VKAAAALVAVALAPGCGQLDAEPKAHGLPEAIQAAQRRMHERFAATTLILQATVHADLARVHAEAHALARLEEPDVLPTWRPYLDEIRLAAAQLELAQDPVAASHLVANLGRRCAACHHAAAAHLTFPREPMPAESGKLAPQMIAHQWAATQMWEGLIGPSDERWLTGAQALAKAPLAIVAESNALGIGDDVARVRMFATRAQKPQAQDERANVYGELLATCTHCHAVIRDR